MLLLQRFRHIIEANGTFCIALIYHRYLYAVLNKKLFACRLNCNNSFWSRPEDWGLLVRSTMHDPLSNFTYLQLQRSFGREKISVLLLKGSGNIVSWKISMILKQFHHYNSSLIHRLLVGVDVWAVRFRFPIIGSLLPFLILQPSLLEGSNLCQSL